MKCSLCTITFFFSYDIRKLIAHKVKVIVRLTRSDKTIFSVTKDTSINFFFFSFFHLTWKLMRIFAALCENHLSFGDILIEMCIKSVDSIQNYFLSSVRNSKIFNSAFPWMIKPNWIHPLGKSVSNDYLSRISSGIIHTFQIIFDFFVAADCTRSDKTERKIP